MKRCLTACLLLFLALTLTGSDALAFRDPFSPAWEFDRPRVYGHPKKMVTRTATYTRREIFNQQGQKMEETLYRPNGEVGIRYLYIWDTDGNLVGIDVWQGSNPNAAEERAQYSAKGVIHAMQGFFEPKRAFVSYDDQGRLSEVSGQDEYGRQSFTWKYAWTPDGDLQELTLIGPGGEVQGRRVFTYNDRHFPETQENYGSDGTLFSRLTFGYDYDKQGNWEEKTTRREVYRDGKVQKDKAEVERVIDYY